MLQWFQKQKRNFEAYLKQARVRWDKNYKKKRNEGDSFFKMMWKMIKLVDSSVAKSTARIGMNALRRVGLVRKRVDKAEKYIEGDQFELGRVAENSANVFNQLQRKVSRVADQVDSEATSILYSDNPRNPGAFTAKARDLKSEGWQRERSQILLNEQSRRSGCALRL